ncbi:MAG: flagellar biosynthesis protein FlhB [Geminicoccaceae bacterium]|nr:flagellar biosynthesis protein FlhB [Geminicoccaceae bacterium]MCX8100463.1 flagellar biosynthesis protein FlhB [Geminicoccaceae bacterium]MDW8370491.1 flagellar biosynthesis protein FlhB [Geminicoccaceae bacterium]
MAEERDEADRTEEPSQRRLEQARERGQVASSREVGHVLVLGSALLLLVAAGPWSTQQVVGALRRLLADAGEPTGLGFDPATRFASALGETALALAPWLAGLLLAGLAGPLLQHAVVFSVTPLAPKLERISPIAGLRRLFSSSTLVELAKSLVKLGLVLGIGYFLFRGLSSELANYTWLSPIGLADRLLDHTMRLTGGVLLALVGLAALDWIWQRHQHRRQLRMTRQEVKEELRESEGDPIVKHRLRQLRMERARRRMMAEVPKATVVVTNPTHYAVALRYDGARMAAPKLVAKGVDQIALKIREIARSHNVPVVENPPLARALYAALEPGDTIPPAHYQAVAELIAYVYRLGGRVGADRANSAISERPRR